MAGKNKVTLTFAGDSEQLEKAAAKAEAATKKVGDSVGKSSEDLRAGFDRVGGASRKLADDVEKSGDHTRKGFDKAGEAADNLDTKAMGARDGVTGLMDSMAAAGEISRGNLTNGLLLAGSGASDLGSSLYNTVIPAVKTAATSLGKFRTALLLSGAGLALAAAATAIYFVKQRQAKKDLSELTDSLADQTGAITDNTRAIVFNNLQKSGMADRAHRLGINLSDLTDAALGEYDALQSVNEVLRQNGAFTAISSDGFAKLSDEQQKNILDAVKLRDAITGQNGELDQARGKWQQQREALGYDEQAQTDAADATIYHAKSVRELADAIRAQTDPVFAYIQAQRDVKEAQDAVREAQDKYGKKSPQYRQAVEDLAEAQIGLFSATGDVATAADEDLLPALKRLKQDGYLSEGAFNALKTAIEKARKEAEKADGTRATITLRFKKLGTGNIHVSDGQGNGGQLVIGAAKGEYITGPGPKGKDSVHRMVAPGEYIVPPEDVDAAGGRAGFEAVLDSLHGKPRSHAAVSGGPQVIENHIYIGDEVVRVVRTTLDEHDRGMKRRVRAGAGR